jgi:hypothetical protein
MKKQSKTLIRVPNVRIGSSVCAVRFKVNHTKKTIKCSTKGQKAFFIRQEGARFVADSCLHDNLLLATHPAQAFAKAVKEFWALW